MALCIVVSAGERKPRYVYLLWFSTTQDIPSDESDAPESLYSSEPIWMGKTRS